MQPCSLSSPRHGSGGLTVHSRCTSVALGKVLGTVDYRVQLPADDANANRRVEWQLLDHRIEEVRLRIDDTVVDQAQGTHTPRWHSPICLGRQANHTVTLEATIAVELSKRTTQFEDGCTPEQTVTETTTETVTATETPTPRLRIDHVPQSRRR